MGSFKFDDLDLDLIDEELDLNETVEKLYVPGIKKQRKNQEKNIGLRKTKKEQDWH